MSALVNVKLALQRWLDEVDPQIREHVGAAATEPVDARDVDRGIAWLREYTDGLAELGEFDPDRRIAMIAEIVELPFDGESRWPEHLREALGW